MVSGALNSLVRGLDAIKKGRNRRQEGFELTPEAAESFQRIKDAFQAALLLAHFDALLKTMMETDSLGEAIYYIISQLHADGH